MAPRSNNQFAGPRSYRSTVRLARTRHPLARPRPILRTDKEQVGYEFRHLREGLPDGKTAPAATQKRGKGGSVTWGGQSLTCICPGLGRMRDIRWLLSLRRSPRCWYSSARPPAALQSPPLPRLPAPRSLPHPSPASRRYSTSFSSCRRTAASTAISALIRAPTAYRRRDRADPGRHRSPPTTTPTTSTSAALTAGTTPTPISTAARWTVS